MAFEPRSSADMAFASVDTLAHLLRRRCVSPVELTQLFLDRIARYDPVLRAFITVAVDQALAAARQRERELAAGRDRGALHGVPIVHKDLFTTRALRTTGHSLRLQNWLPGRDAAVVAKLRNAGVIVLGKANTHEFGNGDTAFFGTPRNPWGTDRVTGGSSAGSASAVAAGLCAAATGTDGGGSLRVPASHCGVVGFKPTYGSVSTAGVLPYTRTFTAAGPMAHTVGDCRLLLVAMGMRQPQFGAAASGVCVGVPREFFPTDLEPGVTQRIEDGLHALRQTGAKLERVELGVDLEAIGAAHTVIERTEAVRRHKPWLQQEPRQYGPLTRRRLLLGCCFRSADRTRAKDIRTHLDVALATAFEKVDVLVGPTVRRTAWSIGEQEPRATLFTKLANMAQIPALSLPCGLGDTGLPVGIQIMGPRERDGVVLSVGEALESTLGLTLRPAHVESVPVRPAPEPEGVSMDQRQATLHTRTADEDEVVAALRRWGMPLLDEDVQLVAADLQDVRDALARWVPATKK